MNQHLARAQQSLEGLSTGDAFGECFFLTTELSDKLMRAGVGMSRDVGDEFVIEQIISMRQVPVRPPWSWTDDTHMALAIFENLRRFDRIDQSTLARRFGENFQSEPTRGYGPAMHRLLPDLARGADCQSAPRKLFGGQGSYGNGAAMRVAPIGAFFADKLELVVQNARASAEVTHAHPEGIAGAVAVAVAAAMAWQRHHTQSTIKGAAFLQSVLEHVPPGVVRDELTVARDLPPHHETTVEEVVEVLGNGAEVMAQDTVPFAIWCASQHLDSYEQALWLTVSGLGDRDTTCAMVGGIVAMSAPGTIPDLWQESREALPEWPFGDA